MQNDIIFREYKTMKNLKSVFLILATVFYSIVGYSQMNGSYTIDPAAAATASNFTSWTNFATAWTF